MGDPVLHFASAVNRTMCGRRLPTFGFHTDDPATFEEAQGRCKQCEHAYYKANPREPLTDITGCDV